MIALDTNILVYAHRSLFPQHQVALEAVRRISQGDSMWALPVFVLGEFLRVVTHPRILQPPTERLVAVNQLDALLASPTAQVLSPGPRYWQLLKDAMEDSGAAGNTVFDAQIVALCIEHGVGTIVSEDRGLRRFSGFTLATL